MGSHVLHRLKLGTYDTCKVFLSKTTRHRALIFGMKHHLVDLYQVLPNYFPVAKNGPATVVILAYIKSTFSEYGHAAYQI